MIYTETVEEYEVKFYQDLRENTYPAREYIKKFDRKERAKVAKYIEFLRINKGYLDEPYSKHINYR